MMGLESLELAENDSGELRLDVMIKSDPSQPLLACREGREFTYGLTTRQISAAAAPTGIRLFPNMLEVSISSNWGQPPSGEYVALYDVIVFVSSNTTYITTLLAMTGASCTLEELTKIAWRGPAPGATANTGHSSSMPVV